MVNNRTSLVALVTGGSGGLGSALAFAFAKAGYAVAVHYHRNEPSALRVVESIRKSGGHAEALRADVGDSADVARMFDRIARRYGRLDVLVHNAGNIAEGLMVRMSAEHFDAVIRTHLRGGFLCTRAAARIMKGQKRGAIVAIVSLVGARGAAGSCNYAAAKAGLMGLCRSAARELGPYGICVNAVSPGYMMTKMGHAAGAKTAQSARRENIFGRWTRPEDSARMIVALCESPWISGQVFNLDARIS